MCQFHFFAGADYCLSLFVAANSKLCANSDADTEVNFSFLSKWIFNVKLSRCLIGPILSFLHSKGKNQTIEFIIFFITLKTSIP